MEEKKKGFSYVSEERKRKQGLKFLLIELVAIMLVVIVAFWLLDYFKIFPTSTILQNLFSSQKAQNTQTKTNTGIDPNLPPQTPVPSKVNYDPKAKPTVEAVSDIQGYKLTLKNKEKLMELLNSWATFEKEYTPRYGAAGSTGAYPLKIISIHLIDTDQGTNAFGRSPQDIYSSSLTKIGPGRFDVYVYIEKPMLDGRVKNFNSGSVFRATLLSSLYKIIHPYSNKTEADKVRDDLYKAFKEDPLMRGDYFFIERE